MRKPPAVAMWLLRRFGIARRDESLMGDLVEECDSGRSAAWFWGQTLIAVFTPTRRAPVHDDGVPGLAAFSKVAAAITTPVTLIVAAMQRHSPAAIGTLWNSDSLAGQGVMWFVILMVIFCLLTSLILLADENFRRAAKMFFAAPAILITYAVAVMLVSLVTPAPIVRIGENYCYDIWCMGVRHANAEPRDGATLVKVDVRIFSDANRVTTSGKGGSVYLIDERGRRFPLLNEPSVVPFDVTLTPGQSVNTSLSFLVPQDTQHLFLTGDPPAGKTAWWPRLFLGADYSLLHKHWLFRIT